MDRPENDPEYWRLQAEDARAAAADLEDPVAKALMNEAADIFERLAELAERHRLIPEPPNAASEP